MQITILNGEPDPSSAFQMYLQDFAQRLASSGHAVTTFDLHELNLKGCSGCWGCWVKTPGECVKRDDSATVCRAAITADLLLLASPLTMGFTTALLKRAADQMIPLCPSLLRRRWRRDPPPRALCEVSQTGIAAGCGRRQRR